MLPVVLMLLACAIGDQGFPAMNLTLELAAMRHELAKGVPYRYVIVYLHELAPPYANHGLGPARASNLAPLGGLVRAGVPFSLHSDAYMAPAEPLTLAWVAANRIASDGRVWGEGQRVPLDLALRAITSEAAFSLGLEDEIGSIAPGKRADFTVLERDPYEVPIEELHRIAIWGTVFEGHLYPID